MNLPDSLPLNSQLAVDDFIQASSILKDRLLEKLKQLQKLEETDFINNEAAFRRYSAIRSDLDAIVAYMRVAELTIEALAEGAAASPVKLQQYSALWIQNDILKKRAQLLEKENEALTQILERSHGTPV